MNIDKSALYLYCFEMLFGDDFKQKQVVFYFKNHYVTANFYKSNPFEQNAHDIEFRKSFFNTFLNNDPFEDKRNLLQQDLIGTMRKFENFVTKCKIEVSSIESSIKDVEFLDIKGLKFPFLRTDSNDVFEPVSIIFDEILD
ncbi:hypothetical protein ACYSNU_07345 [Enterococcus sp. LJL120]